MVLAWVHLDRRLFCSFGCVTNLFDTGTSSEAVGTPDEHIGYIASEEYASRITSPRPPSAQAGKARTSSSNPPSESPLRKMSFPAGELEKLTKTTSRAVESETEDEVIHIDLPARRLSRMMGLNASSEELLLPSGTINEDEEHTAPILAPDEVAKRPEAEYLQPAVTPDPERRASAYYDADAPLQLSGRRGSRNSSRPSSIHGVPALTRQISHEDPISPPLDNVKEYEPLFPDEDEKHTDKPTTHAGKVKRPDTLARHHFPSQDIWEDTPESLRLEATVETPQVPLDAEGAANQVVKTAPPTFESPEQEAARKNKISAEDQQSFLTDHTKKAKNNFGRAVRDEMAASRPGLKQRFPSQDIWEDSPDSTYITTTVESPPESQDKELGSPETDVQKQPPVPPRPVKGDVESSKPIIPTRPTLRSKQSSSDQQAEKEVSPERKVPVVPARPKPQIPVRPNKAAAAGTSTERDISPSKAEPPAIPKAKPAVPARQLGGKIAALKAGFMSDLNSRLQLGPQAPKKEEPKEEVVEEAEKAPLADARKGRARGPQRRKPGASPSASAAAAADADATTTPAVPKVKFAFVASTIWSIDDDNALAVPLAKKTASPPAAVTPAPTVASSVEADAKKPADEPELPPAKPSTLEEVQAAGEEEEELTPAPAAAKVALPEKVEEEAPETLVSEATQTGAQEIQVNSTDGSSEKLSVFLGARAPEEGTVIVKESGEEIVHDGDERGLATKTGPGV